MERLAISTLAAQDISSPLLVYTHTATAVREVEVQVYLSGLAGNGTYRACLTKQLLGAGSVYQSETVALTLAAGTTTAWLPVIALPVNSTDVVKVYVEGQAGDVSVAINTEIFDTLTSIESALTTLGTASSITVQAAVSGSTVTVYAADTWSFTVTLSGITAWADYEIFAFKVAQSAYVDDDNSFLLVRSDDGLVRINQAAPVASGNGTFTNNGAGSFSVLVAVAETTAIRAQTLTWWLKAWDTTDEPDQVFTVGTGTFVIRDYGVESIAA
jgi:hypothetical protein